MTELGYSSIAIIFTIIVGSVALIAGIGFGLCRSYSGGMPVAGSCSAAISAACHQPDQSIDTVEKPMMWGVAENVEASEDARAMKIDEKHEKYIGHCSFTSLPAVPPQEGREYAGITRTQREK